MVSKIFIYKKLFLLACLLLLSINAYSQTYQWARQFAADHARGQQLVTDNNHSVISVGHFGDSIDLDPSLNTHWVSGIHVGGTAILHHSYISKLDSNGIFDWGFTYNSSGFDNIHSVDVDNQDNIIVVGKYHDSIDLDFGPGSFWLHDTMVINNNHNTVFIAKYSPSGVLLWGRGLQCNTASSLGGIIADCIKVDNANNILITGRFHDTIDFDPGPGVYNLVGTYQTFSNTADEFLLKLSPNGNFIWVRRWRNTGATMVANIASYSNKMDIDRNGNILMPIMFRDSLDVDPSPIINTVYNFSSFTPLTDICFLKISPFGSLIWHKEIQGNAVDQCYSVATDKWNNIYYYISTQSNNIDIDPGPNTNYLNWVILSWHKVVLKLDNAGNFLWAQKNMDTIANNLYFGTTHSLAADTNGGLYITTGVTYNIGTGFPLDIDPGPNTYIVNTLGGYDIIFQNLDPSGNFVWGGLIGGSGADVVQDIETDNGSGVYMNGYFSQTADFNPTVDSNFLTSTLLGADPFVLKLKNCNRVTNQIHQACDSILFNSQYYFYDTVIQTIYAAFNGCDSAHNDIIDVKTQTNDTLQVSACDFYYWNGVAHQNSGFFTHNYGIPGGCDSIVTIDLSIRSKSTDTLNISACDTFSLNGLGYNASGTYHQFFTNSLGCDSIITLNLSINNSSITTINTFACESIILNGIVYTSSGTYTQNYFGTSGCDSNVVLNYTLGQPDTSINPNSIFSLTANALGATYQWLNCQSVQLMPGDTNALFATSNAGNYACIISQNGCTDTSYCYSLSGWPNAVQENTSVSLLFPNPSSGSYHLKLDRNYQDVSLEIRTMSGQLLWKKSFEQLKETDLKIEEASGVYMLYIKQGERTQVKKLLKW